MAQAMDTDDNVNLPAGQPLPHLLPLANNGPNNNEDFMAVLRRIQEHKSNKYRYRSASNGKLIKVEDRTSDEEEDCHSSSHSCGRNDDYSDDEDYFGAELSAQQHAGWE